MACATHSIDARTGRGSIPHPPVNPVNPVNPVKTMYDTTITHPTLAELRAMPLSEVLDIAGKKSCRIGSTKAVQYKIADCSDPHASRVIVIDWYGGEGSGSALGSRQLIRSCDDGPWDQFIHRGC